MESAAQTQRVRETIFSEDFEAYADGSLLAAEGGWEGEPTPISSNGGLAGTGNFVDGRSGPRPEDSDRITRTDYLFSEPLRMDAIYTLTFEGYAFNGVGKSHNAGVGLRRGDPLVIGAISAGPSTAPDLSEEGWAFNLSAFGGISEKILGHYDEAVTASIVLDPINGISFGRLTWDGGSEETTHGPLDLEAFEAIDGIFVRTDWRGFDSNFYKGAHFDNIVLTAEREEIITPPTQTGEILVVDRNEANPAAGFHTIQEALNAAEPGATIYVMPSGEPYNEGPLISKPVTLIGSGWGREHWFPSSVRGESVVTGLRIRSSDVFVTGMVVDGGNASVEGPANLSNIVISRNKFNGTLRLSTDQSTMKITNLFVLNNDLSSIDHSRGELVDAVIANNIVRQSLALLTGNGDVFQNIFTGVSRLSTTTNVLNRNANPDGFIGRFYNNIVEVTPTGGVPPDQSRTFLSARMSYQNNLFRSSVVRDFMPGAIVFESLVAIVGAGPNGEPFVPVEGGPAIGSGVNGEDLGIYGGTNPWNPNQQPSIPIITEVVAPRIITSDEEFRITVQVEVNR